MIFLIGFLGTQGWAKSSGARQKSHSQSAGILCYWSEPTSRNLLLPECLRLVPFRAYQSYVLCFHLEGSLRTGRKYFSPRIRIPALELQLCHLITVGIEQITHSVSVSSMEENYWIIICNQAALGCKSEYPSKNYFKNRDILRQNKISGLGLFHGLVQQLNEIIKDTGLCILLCHRLQYDISSDGCKRLLQFQASRVHQTEAEREGLLPCESLGWKSFLEDPSRLLLGSHAVILMEGATMTIRFEASPL